MKPVLVRPLTFLLFTLYTAGATAAEWVVGNGRVGLLRVGMQVETAKSILGLTSFRMVDLENEGLFSPAILVSNHAGRSVIGELSFSANNQWTLWRIDIYDPRYRTAHGIHVGSSYKDLRRREPELKLIEEEGRWVVDTLAGVSYQIGAGPLESATVTQLVVYEPRTR